MTGNYDRIYDPIFINTKYYKTNGWKKKKKREEEEKRKNVDYLQLRPKSW